MRYPLVEHGGEGVPLHWAPATGFPLTTYRPILDELARTWRCVSIPPRALWPDVGPPPDRPGSWADQGREMLEGLRQHGIGPTIAIGHSAGGVASLLAAIAEPGMIRALVMLDPTILPARVMDAWRGYKAEGWKHHPHPLARRARERRGEFASYQEAFGYFRDRPIFGDWSDDALRLYVEGILAPLPRTGFTLRWSGAWEAHSYESIHLETWSDLLRLDCSVPVLVIRGGASDTFTEDSAGRFHALVPWATMATVPGFGHLFPQAAPRETFKLIDDWLRRTVGIPDPSR